MESIRFSKTVFQGNGDGTVNYRSLVGCTRWADQQKQRVTHHEFPGVDHLQVYLLLSTRDWKDRIPVSGFAFIAIVRIHLSKLKKKLRQKEG